MKGHFRLSQALQAVAALGGSEYGQKLMSDLHKPGGAMWPDGLLEQRFEWEVEHGSPNADIIDAETKRFKILSQEELPDRLGRRSPGIWLGFRLLICHWLEPSVYLLVYEDPRADDWRNLATMVMTNHMAPKDTIYDYRCLRCV